ncbi:tetratricopeptide repeat-containing sensor histidine kinase [Terrimonas alba]|uniref:tetratricopeptide repeat-containing sensor histidine kinase n=1 Tax=Terrimonas alba TaxID=3349636 RepID=UPI0035F3095E
MNKHFIIFVAATAAAFICTAQTAATRDSLLNILKTAKEDTNKVYLLLSIADEFEGTEPEKAKMYITGATNLSNQLNYPAGLMKAYRHFAYVYSYQSKFDSAIYFNKIVLNIARQQKDSFNIGAAYFNIGTSYRYLFELDSALQYILEGTRLLDGKGYYNIESTLNDGLQALYMTLMQYDKAIMYGEKAVAIGRRLENKQPLVNALNNLGLSYVEVNREDDAVKVYREGLGVAENIGYKAVEAMLLNNLSDIAIRSGQYEPVLGYAQRSLAIAAEMGDGGTAMNAKVILACYHFYKKDFNKAEELAKEVLEFSEKQSLDDGKIAALGVLAKTAFATGQYSKGFGYETQQAKIQSAVFNESVKQREAGIRVRFETEKKDNQIKIQKAELQSKNTLNYILIGSAVTLLVISLLSYRNYLQKQKLHQQRINELETEKQLTATEAVLKGEEQERTRLAKDLHDGLGGMLSGIKYSFQTMKGNLVMTPDNHQAFERSMDMLDSSIKEMRRVAHNMMPEALVKFGLDTALKDFCNDINQSGALQVTYQSIGLENTAIEQTTAIAIYRIVQELINNTMKHASAKMAIVQVTKTDENISITVEDDGKGFDPVILKGVRGIGWSNIQSRIEYLKGKLDVQSEPGKGTSVLIELKA